jgi:hypothetical protein
MHWNPLRWDIDAAWLALKRLAAKSLMIIFGLAALLSFGAVAVQFGAEGINWLKTGTWESAKTIADTWPNTANSVAGIKWIGLQRIGLWVIAQSVLWAYVALGVTCFTISTFFSEIEDNLQQRWHS